MKLTNKLNVLAGAGVAAIAMAIAGTASAGLVLTSYNNDTDANNAINGVGGNKAIHTWVAEGRIGNRTTNGTHELDLGKTTNGPFVTDNSGDRTANVAKQQAITSGQVVPFSIMYDPAAITPLVTFTFGSTVMEYIPTGIVNTLLIRTRSGTALPSSANQARMTLSNLVVDGQSVGTVEALTSSATGLDILQVTGGELTDGFTMTGNAEFFFTGTAPTNSALAFQLKADTVVPEPSAVGLLAGGAAMLLRRRK
jgi:hypothetical protein